MGQTWTHNIQRHYQSQQGLEILWSDSSLINTRWEREQNKQKLTLIYMRLDG